MRNNSHRAYQLLLSLAAGLVGAMSLESAEPASPIVVPQCRVLLIDQVTLACEAPGILQEVVPEEGDIVEAGAVVAGLKRESALAALAVAERQATDDVELRYARKASELAATEFDRAKSLRTKSVASDSEYERARLESERALLQIEKAESQLAINRLVRDEKQAQLNAHLIRSPIAGRVTRVFRRAGEAVRQGDPVIEVVSARRLRVEGYVSAKRAGGIHPGDRATVESSIDDKPPQRLPARIVFIDDSIEPNSRTIRIWAEVKNENGTLRAGQQASLILDRTRP